MTAHIEYYDELKLAKRREPDVWGAGHFHAGRGHRKHKGIDFQVPPNSQICAPVSGKVIKLGYAYSDDLSYRYIRIEDFRGNSVDVFYVNPTVETGRRVKKGDVIGVSQDLDRRYAGITEHVHLQVLKPDGVEIDPDVYFT